MKVKSVLVYSANSRNPWNGKLNNTGRWCKEGDYTWEISHLNDKGEVNNYKGNCFYWQILI